MAQRQDREPIDQHGPPEAAGQSGAIAAAATAATVANDPVRREDLIASQIRKVQTQAKKLNFEYYCGSQAQIFFGQVLIDDCVYVGWNMNSSKVPIYSYANRLWSTVAEGPVEVTGSFGLNFKENSYLYVIQSYLSNRKGLTDDAEVARKAMMARVGDQVQSRSGAERSPLTATRMQEQVQELSSVDDQRFHQLSQAFEDILWSKGNRSSSIATSEILRTTGGRTRADEFPAFDIYLTFGNTDDPQAASTVVRLKEVELTGRRMQYSIDGVPIAEHFTFLARDIE